mmetsp:Transcript_168640/g.541856  ORF Transcript_168640/g.541856 Transcript_168640/m.541856 type:complete len:629 (+) Transcript_168640:142-2028(+)
MGRLPGGDGATAAAVAADRGTETPTCSKQVEPTPTLTLAERIEQWRSDPDMCLIWAAFCTNSALQLSDGLKLAKTKSSSTEVLGILTGRHGSCTDGSATTYKGVFKTAVAAKANRADANSDGPDDDDDASTLAPNSVPSSPSQGPSSAPTTPNQVQVELDGTDIAACTARTSTARALWQEGYPQHRLASRALRVEPPAAVGADYSTLPPTRPAPRRTASKTCQGGGDDKVGAEADPRDSNLAHFGDVAEVDFPPWSSSPFAGWNLGQRFAASPNGEVRLLECRKESSSSSSCSSSIASGGFAVVAKIVPACNVEKCRLRNPNERRGWLADGEVPPMEDLDNEVAVLSLLQREPNGLPDRGPFFVQLLGAFRDDSSFFMVMEHCEGGDVFDKVAHGAPLADCEKKRYISQILQAVQYLHERNIAHRDISLENVLLRSDNECVLVDFAQAVPVRGLDGKGLRYFAEAGKRVYRAPEMYIPRQQVVQVVCPSNASPGAVVQISYDKCRCEVLLPADAVPGRPCAAETFGYAVAPADVFACGVCAFMLIVGKPPWAVTRDSDPTFSFIRRHGVAMLLKQWRVTPSTPGGSEEEGLLSQMLRTEPCRRASVEECLRSPWLAEYVPTHLRNQTV